MLTVTLFLRQASRHPAQESSRSIHDIVQFPKAAISSLPFVPPPRWATMVPSRLDKAFPSLERKRSILFLKALIHPSYTTESAIGGTMASLTPIGNAVLVHSLQCAVANVAAREGSSNLNPQKLAQDICNEEVLSAVLKGGWGLEDLILTDSVVKEIRDVRTSKGLREMSSPTVIPIGYHRQCALAIIGAVYLDSGLGAAKKFINCDVLPIAMEYLTLQ